MCIRDSALPAVPTTSTALPRRPPRRRGRRLRCTTAPRIRAGRLRRGRLRRRTTLPGVPATGPG
eukprot:8417914-Prorocentrum_lima.AAC.1